MPAVCKVQLDIRYLPDDSADNIINDIKNIIKEVEAECPPARFDLKIISNQLPTAVPINNPLVELISKHTLSILGTKPQPKGDVRRNGNQATHPKRYNCRWFGPGDEAEAHATNESISIKELIDFAKIMALITLDILT